MGGVRKADVTALRDELRLVRLGDAAPWDGILEVLRRVGGFRLTMRYGIEDTGGQIEPRQLTTSGPEALPLRSALAELLGARAIAYDPRKAPRRQRNRAQSLETLARLGDADQRTISVYRHLMRSTIGRPLEQVRMLVCEGATVLGWVGGFAPEATARQAALLTALGPALRERLRFEEALSRLPLAEATLDAIMEAAEGPVALVDSAGRPFALNALARERFDASPTAARRTWRDAVQGNTTDYRRVTLDAPGFPRHHFLIARDDRGASQGRLTARTVDWKLSLREQQVLALVVRGRTNEMIARDLDCAVRTVELYVSRLLQRAGVDNRASLVARFWSDAVDDAALQPNARGHAGPARSRNS